MTAGILIKEKVISTSSAETQPFPLFSVQVNVCAPAVITVTVALGVFTLGAKTAPAGPPDQLPVPKLAIASRSYDKMHV